MRYENVSNIEELNFRVNNYINSGYELKIQGDNYAKLVKDDFSWGIFIILLIFLVIGALVYWAIVSGNKDEFVIQLGNGFNNVNNNDVTSNNNVGKDINNININNKDLACPSCGFENNNGSKFCYNCGSELNDIENSDSEKCSNFVTTTSEDSKKCPNFITTTSEDSKKCPNFITTTSEDSKKCPNCGTITSEDSKFCYSCGKSVE